jgi:anti-anti-sigma regulatory factor
MLDITIEEYEQEIWISLKGCMAGPDVSELNQAWAQLEPRLAGRNVAIDLRGVTQSDKAGVQALGEIYTRTRARLLTEISDYLALEIMYGQEDGVLMDTREWVTN